MTEKTVLTGVTGRGEVRIIIVFRSSRTPTAGSAGLVGIGVLMERSVVVDPVADVATSQPGERDLVCRLMIKPPLGPVLVGLSDARAAVIDDAEYESVEGPALESPQPSSTVEVAEWEGETRGRRYRALADKLDVIRSLSCRWFTRRPADVRTHQLTLPG